MRSSVMVLGSAVVPLSSMGFALQQRTAFLFLPSLPGSWWPFRMRLHHATGNPLS